MIYNTIKFLKNPLLIIKYSNQHKKKLALLTAKRAYKGGIIMKKIVLLFVASVRYSLNNKQNYTYFFNNVKKNLKKLKKNLF